MQNGDVTGDPRNRPYECWVGGWRGRRGGASLRVGLETRATQGSPLQISKMRIAVLFCWRASHVLAPADGILRVTQGSRLRVGGVVGWGGGGGDVVGRPCGVLGWKRGRLTESPLRMLGWAGLGV